MSAIEQAKLYPLCFRPVYKDYLWGGDRIISRYKRSSPPGVYAESWEISDRDDGMSIVCNGAFEGRSLHDVVRELGPFLLGEGRTDDSFPLLIKIIDARQRLSVQVHPTCESAARFGGEPKTEMWYVLDAEPGAGVFAGFSGKIDEAAFMEAVRAKDFGRILSFIPVKKGDVVFIPGGRVHAIDSGCLLLEVQQNSNTTYRIHDWDRAGSDGKPRPLHLDQAMRAINWNDAGAAKVSPQEIERNDAKKRSLLLECPFFRLERLALSEPHELGGNKKTFRALFIEEGQLSLKWSGNELRLDAGTSCLIPAALEDCLGIPHLSTAVLISELPRL